MSNNPNGRPVTEYGEVIIGVRVSEDDKSRLRQISQNHGLTLSKFVRELLRSKISEHCDDRQNELKLSA
jgi:predicted DNA-binding protein|tara:strand:+ start:5523 stop:5729 length:207 start_codon:yes stop_codon:yes gene_type:complete